MQSRAFFAVVARRQSPRRAARRRRTARPTARKKRRSRTCKRPEAMRAVFNHANSYKSSFVGKRKTTRCQRYQLARWSRKLRHWDSRRHRTQSPRQRFQAPQLPETSCQRPRPRSMRMSTRSRRWTRGTRTARPKKVSSEVQARCRVADSWLCLQATSTRAPTAKAKTKLSGRSASR